MSLPIIVDCDPGNGIPGANVDDALALVYALRHPELDCRAVWTVFGNTPSDTGAKCAQEIVDRAALSGQTPPCIRQGSTHPLHASTQRWDRQRKEYASSPEGVRAWGDGRFVPVSGDGDSSIDEAVAEKLFRDVADVASAGAPTVADQKVTIVAIGPLTNIARMLVAHPECSELLEQIVLMGGCFGFGDLVDTNFAVDPEATQIVFASDRSLQSSQQTLVIHRGHNPHQTSVCTTRQLPRLVNRTMRILNRDQLGICQRKECH